MEFCIGDVVMLGDVKAIILDDDMCGNYFVFCANYEEFDGWYADYELKRA